MVDLIDSIEGRLWRLCWTFLKKPLIGSICIGSRSVRQAEVPDTTMAEIMPSPCETKNSCRNASLEVGLVSGSQRSSSVARAASEIGHAGPRISSIWIGATFVAR